MRRAILALTATTAIVIGLLEYKTSSAPSQFRITAGAAPPSRPAASSSTPGDPPSAPPAVSSPPAVSAPPSASAAPSPPAQASPGTARTVTGPVVSTRFGDVEVAVNVTGKRVTDVQAPELPYDRPRSASISQYVAPVLRSEALAAQSAQIDTVSGATYTSDAYAQSLQAALAQAGL
jgi:uncharacterized protein with FMN-binding domain